jgi:uncharacterized membrane protein
MLTWRAPWWMYLLAAVYVLTFIFNGRQEIWGPANAGWLPSLPTFKVVSVAPGRPMDQAGLRAGDVLEAVDGQPLKGMPDWFVARAHFERDYPVELQVRRGEQRLSLRLVIAAPAWRNWSGASYFGVVALYFARFMLLSLALLVAFSRPEQLSARLAALMFAVGAVAEGYPSSGWAAALHQLPAVLAIPICVATASCLLAPMVWLSFFSSFPRPWLSPKWRWGLVLVPLAFFAFPIVASAIAMIYAPSSLAKPWPAVLSAAPVRLTQDIAGVAPLLFLNVWPLYQPILPTTLLEIWLVLTVLYFVAGYLMLTANYRRLSDQQERRGVGALCVALLLFGVIIVHNSLTRNWTGWFGTAPPALFSAGSFAGEAVLFQLVPLALAYCVLTERGRGRGETNTLHGG